MANNVELPSGSQVVNLFADDPKEVAASTDKENMEATAGAMELDVEGRCPKCSQGMGLSIAAGEQAYYCEPCRVCLPLPSQD